MNIKSASHLPFLLDIRKYTYEAQLPIRKINGAAKNISEFIFLKTLPDFKFSHLPGT